MLTAATSIPPNAWDRIIIAYEPVWAIGAGANPCPPAEAQRILQAIRQWIATQVSPQAAQACRLVYIGSINEVNAVEYASLPDVDGFVVGRAGLDAAKLQSIWKTLAAAAAADNTTAKAQSHG